MVRVRTISVMLVICGVEKNANYEQRSSGKGARRDQQKVSTLNYYFVYFSRMRF